MPIHRQNYPLVQANPKMAADQTLVNLEFKHIYEALNDIESRLGGGGGGGTAGVKYWDELLKRANPSITALMAFGDWQTSYESLATHVNKYVDPHSSHPEWTVGVKTPLVDARGNLNLLPASGSALLIGDPAGTFRKMAWGDAPAMQTDWGAWFAATFTDPSTPWQTLLGAQLTFNSNTATKYGRGITGAVRVAGTNAPGGGIGIEGHALVLGTAAPGYMVGVWGHALTDAAYSGTVPELTAVRATVRNQAGTVTLGRYFAVDDVGLAGSGTITTLIGLDIPALTKGGTNYGMRLGANTHLVNATQTWTLAAATCQWILKHAASQSADPFQIRHSDGSTVIDRFDANGCLGINYAPSAADSVLDAAYGSSSGGPNIRLRGALNTTASPQTLTSGKILGSLIGCGYDGSAWSSGQGAFRILAGETWDSTHHGTYLRFDTTPNGSTTSVATLTLTDVLLTFKDALNIAFNTSTGTKIGTGTTQKLAFYGSAPVVKQQVSGTSKPPAGTFMLSVVTALETLGLIYE